MGNGIWIGIIIVLVVVIALMVGVIRIPGVHLGSTIPAENECGTDLSYMLHYTIDRVDPTLFPAAAQACVVNSGTWFDGSDKVGCYDMPTDTFNTTNCDAVMATIMENVCNSVQATWSCSDTNVGCAC